MMIIDNIYERTNRPISIQTHVKLNCVLQLLFFFFGSCKQKDGSFLFQVEKTRKNCPVLPNIKQYSLKPMVQAVLLGCTYRNVSDYILQQIYISFFWDGWVKQIYHGTERTGFKSTDNNEKLEGEFGKFYAKEDLFLMVHLKPCPGT